MRKSDFLFLLVLASVPLQLGKHFFFSHSYIFGLPIDYRSLTIYFSDFAVILYLSFFFYENRSKLAAIFKKLKAFILAVLVFDAYLLIGSIFFSTSPEASLIFTAKVIMFSALAVAATFAFSKNTVIKAGNYFLKRLLILESALLIAEFTAQKSLGLSILGERTFDTTTTSIAHVNFFGHQLLRPYGTFPHPNVAAAFLIFGLILVLGAEVAKKRPNINAFSLLVTLAGLSVTFSKSAFAAAAVAFGILFAQKKGILVLAVTLFTAAFLFLKNTPDSGLATISERILLIQKSLDITRAHPFFGVGSNNFILELAKLDLFSVSQVRLLQPVHNIFFLILTENGVLGLLLFTATLFVALRSVDTKTKAALFALILIFGSVDHFLWTLQQGQLTLWLSLGYILAKSVDDRR